MQPYPDPDPRPLDHLPQLGRQGDLALIDRRGALDFLGLERATAALAGALLSRGLPKGERVASWLGKTRMACLLPLACARVGLIHVPINPLLKRAQVAHILADCDARILFAGATRSGTLIKGDRPQQCALLIEDEERTAALAQGSGPGPSQADPDALAALLYTSGSTGKPKGVMLSHANLWLGAVSVAAYLRLSPEDRTLCVLPLSFDYGQNQLLASWAAGAAAVPLDYLAPRDVIRAVEQFGITTLAGIPSLWRQLVYMQWPEESAGRLRCITNSGGKLPVALVRRMRELFPNAALHSMYGLTEAFRAASLDPALIDDHPESVGTPIPLAELSVINREGKEAQPGEAGELVQSGPLVAKGYWGDPVRTAERFRARPDGLPGYAVWSGDQVRRDENGLIHFVGREDEMIKTLGNRLSPHEIEEAALESGCAQDAVAVGVPDEQLGQAIKLIVTGNGDEAGLLEHLKRELPTFMQPRQIVWRSSLPLSVNGKIDRARIRAEEGY